MAVNVALLGAGRIGKVHAKAVGAAWWNAAVRRGALGAASCATAPHK